MAKVWAADKVKVDRTATPPEEPMTNLAAALQAIENAGYTSYAIQEVCQDLTDSSWVVVYVYEP